MKSNNEVTKINNLRAIAILIVMFGHSIILYSEHWNLYTTDRICETFNIMKKMIDVIQMPLYFFISGYLFYWTFCKKDFMTIIKDKIRRLLVPFISIGLFWMLPIRLVIKYPGYNDVELLDIIFYKICLGYDNGHLWFLPTLFLCFIFLLIIKKLESVLYVNNKALLVFHTLIIIMCCIIKPLNVSIYLDNVYNYFFYFYLGFLMNEYRHIIDYIQSNRTIQMILLFFWMIFLCSLVFITNSFIKNVLGIIFVILMFLHVPDRNSPIMNIIAKYSFGIYLFHSPLVYITFSFFNNTFPMLVMFLNFFVFGLLAFCMSKICSENKVLKKLIGEK